MPIKKPASFTAGRKIILNGTTFQPGAAISNPIVKALKRMDALLSNGSIVSNLDPYSRKGKAATSKPTSFNPPMRSSL